MDFLNSVVAEVIKNLPNIIVILIGFLVLARKYTEARLEDWKKDQEVEREKTMQTIKTQALKLQTQQEEHAAQRAADSEYRIAQIKQLEASMQFNAMQLENNAKFAASLELLAKHTAESAQATRATEKALTDNTTQLGFTTEAFREFGDKFLERFNRGSEPVRRIESVVLDFQEHGVKPDEAAREQITRIETAVNEVKDKVLPCVEAQSVLESELLSVLREARVLIEMFNRDAQMKIEDKRKTDSKPIPAITIGPTEKQEGAQDSQTGMSAA